MTSRFFPSIDSHCWTSQTMPVSSPPELFRFGGRLMNMAQWLTTRHCDLGSSSAIVRDKLHLVFLWLPIGRHGRGHGGLQDRISCLQWAELQLRSYHSQLWLSLIKTLVFHLQILCVSILVRFNEVKKIRISAPGRPLGLEREKLTSQHVLPKHASHY